ncbi:hypothetical protein [Moraxella macacae]|uniref:hypothetical protein n=1 Tax=Moraxella macacae TaxID=765840 RepID=UPI00031E760E|nr:hypothetical protein [Moraxella macacae]
MLIVLYIYKKSDGTFLYQDTGNPDDVIKDLLDNKDFTLTPIPNNDKLWRWVDGRWV